MANSEHSYLEKAKALVEAQLEWDKPENWTNQDFHELSNRILTKTGCHLSAVTLKRIWGRIQYKSTPSTTTLTILVKFAGFENWREFKISQLPTPELPTSKSKLTQPQLTSPPNLASLNNAFTRISLLVATMLVLTICSFYLLERNLPVGSPNQNAANKNVPKFNFFGPSKAIPKPTLLKPIRKKQQLLKTPKPIVKPTPVVPRKWNNPEENFRS